MNASLETDTPMITARMCSSLIHRKVAYAFLDNSDFLYLDKRDILQNQIYACERLLRYAIEEKDRLAISNEIEELKCALDLMH
ncbi:MAG: hypothetical protein ACJ70U_00430 [Nitrososphaera sp.]